MRTSPLASWRFGGALALLTLAAAACSDSEGPLTGGPAPGGNGGIAGESSEPPGGQGEPQAGAPTTGGAGPSNGEALIPPGEPCTQDAECDDGLYCNGKERCAQQSDSDFSLCEVTEILPCVPEYCDEAGKRCDCSNPDKDGDTVKAPACAKKGERSDCDDDDDRRYPGHAEVCDGADPTLDEDCNPETVAGVAGDGDKDGDKFIDQACANFLPYQLSRNPGQERLKKSGNDCNDKPGEGKSIHPGAEEVCDKLDNDCNGKADEISGEPSPDDIPYYPDFDDDKFGSNREEDVLWSRCNFPPPRYVRIQGDCDDANWYAAPSRSEICNGVDDDCNFKPDDRPSDGSLLSEEPFDGVTQFECRGVDGWYVQEGGCPKDRLDCDRKYLNACEVPATTLCNCHECGAKCSFSCGKTGCEEVQGGSTGSAHTCFLVAGPALGSQPVIPGTVACAGLNLSSQLGDGSTKDRSVAARIPELTHIIQVSGGSRHTCALNDAGTILCWGNNRVGQLGASLSAETHREPIAVSQFYVGASAKQIASGAYHTCALYELAGSTYIGCWGSGDVGQLGRRIAFPGHYQDRPRDVLVASGDEDVPLKGASEVASGYDHTCALIDGKVMCWGINDSWQLGIDPTEIETSPVAILVPGLEGVEEIVAAANHTCARAGSDVFCWGLNDRHQLATEGDAAGPTRVPLPQDVVSLAAGSDFACALRENGVLLCWGSNIYGERGVNGDLVAPSIVPITDIKRTFAGQGSDLCVVTDAGSTLCLGRNDFGQLANGTASAAPQPLPSQVSPLAGQEGCRN